MYPIVLPDSRTRELPTRWGEVTLGQAARLAELPTGADVYSWSSVLLDLSPKEVMNLPRVPRDFMVEEVLPCLAFMEVEMPDFGSMPLPQDITLAGSGQYDARRLPVAPAIEVATFGQATDLGALLLDVTMPVSQKRLQALAILFYPAYVSGDYDSDATAQFAEAVCSRAKLEDAMPVTDFFLRSSTASAAATWPSSSASPSAPTSAPPASKPSWRSGMRWLWSTRSPLGTKPSGPTSGASSGAR